MQGSPPFDPPEYVNWKPDAALVKAYRATIEADSERAAVVSALSPDAKLALYAGLLRARLHDIQLQRWVRTGVISKAWLGTGEEGTTVGPVHALERSGGARIPSVKTPGGRAAGGRPSTPSPALTASGRRSWGWGAPGSKPKGCWRLPPPPRARRPAARRAGGPPCSLPRRSAWAGTRR